MLGTTFKCGFIRVDMIRYIQLSVNQAPAYINYLDFTAQTKPVGSVE